MHKPLVFVSQSNELRLYDLKLFRFSFYMALVKCYILVCSTLWFAGSK